MYSQLLFVSLQPNKTNMLRIYFDWNCITHLKDSEGEKLFDYIISNKPNYIFPFSPAHFEDLQRSRPCKNRENKDYYKDLTILHNICDNHLIMFDNDKKRVLPFAATPYEYIEKADSCTFDLFLQSIGFNNFEEYLNYVEKYPLEDKDIDERYREFLNRNIESREYAENYLF